MAKFNRLILTGLPLLFWHFHLGHAAGLSIITTYGYALPEDNVSSRGSEGSGSIGFGLGLDLSLSKRLTLEVSALRLSRKWTYSGSRSDTLSHTLLSFPVGLRFRFFRSLSLGAGISWATYQGQISVEDSSGNASQTSYSQENRSTSDLGGYVSLRAELGLSKKLRLFIEPRYQIGLKDNDVSAQQLFISDFLFLLGFRFDLSRGEERGWQI